MKINIAKSAGFCFGVKRAVDIALKTAKNEKNVEMLGDIVHNEEVVKAIRNAGIRKVKRLKKGENKVLLIRAHGVSRDTVDRANKFGYKIIDATCPMVRGIHNIVRKMEKMNCKPIIIGDKKHDEVKGIIGQIKTKPIIIDSINNIPYGKIKKVKRACVVVQSTQNIEKVIKLVSILKNYIEDLKFFNTVCNPTRIKQNEIKTMPKENDIMIIIGSKTSANTKRLYEISKSLNKKSFWIQSKNDIKTFWFKDISTVGITAGASTPDYTTKEIVDFIKNLNN
ncbi:MAG: 4-hydroxy-3-methylbut-2-enyl diphosphate reductase [Candidatus Omnitrophica bacterium]|nr:4-hydroxy-3-methylbut-2-enyl diphosphate reductase [Candidatus Omnitrophota bacterium]